MTKVNFWTRTFFQTKKAGKILAEEILKTGPQNKAVVIGLTGELGSGKTTFLQGFAKGLGIREKILSPTFVLVKKFPIPNPKFKTFYHIDCYRIKSPKEILDLGFKEIVSDHQNIVAVEWADRLKRILPSNTIWLYFDSPNTKTRKITFLP